MGSLVAAYASFGRPAMTLRAGDRMALAIALALLSFVAAGRWTAETSHAAEMNSQAANLPSEVNQAPNGKRKSARLVQSSSEEEKSGRSGYTKASQSNALPAPVADANARMEGGEVAGWTAREFTARADAPFEEKGQGNALVQLAEADQLNEIDKAIQGPAPPAQTTAAVAPARPAAMPGIATEEISTWSQTSLIGKIFIAFGALLTIASAARMFMA